MGDITDRGVRTAGAALKVSAAKGEIQVRVFLLGGHGIGARDRAV